MNGPQESPERMLHLLIGSPDPENCEICRAHALAPGDPETPVDPVDPGILIQELSLGHTLRCPCPLCTEARQGEL